MNLRRFLGSQEVILYYRKSNRSLRLRHIRASVKPLLDPENSRRKISPGKELPPAIIPFGHKHIGVWEGTYTLMDRKQAIAVRIDRARMAERFDMWVLKAFLLTTPFRILVAHLRGYELITTPCLSLKLALLGLELDADLRRRVIRLAYPVWLLYGIIMVIIFIALTKHIF